MNTDELTEAQRDRLFIWQMRSGLEPPPFWETMVRAAPFGLFAWVTQWAMVAVMRPMIRPMFWIVKHRSRVKS